jgi:excisionase family DNA binding protein
MTKDTSRPPLTDEMYTVAEVARYFKVTTAAVYKWMTLGKLEYIKVGNDRRVTRGAIDAFIKASTESRPGDDSGKIDTQIGTSGHVAPFEYAT